MSNLAFNIYEKGQNEKAKVLRKNGEIPCVVYGDGIENSLPAKISKNEVIKLNLPINFINEEYLENKRLVLETFNAEIEIQGIASEMPEMIEVNLEGLVFEDKIFAKNIILPKNIHLVTAPDTLLAIVAGSDNNQIKENDNINSTNLNVE